MEQKFNKMRRPLFDKRTDLIKKIPEFWLTAFLNHPQVSSIVDEDEEDCFEYLDILEVEEAEDIKTGYKLNFHFRDNPFFTNKCLTKEFKLGAESTVPSSASTTIAWKEGKDLTKLLQTKAQASGGRRRRHAEYKAFFDWFQDNTDPVNDEIAELIKDDLWPNPLQYFLVPDIEVDEEDEGDENDEEEEVDDDEDGGGEDGEAFNEGDD